MSWSTETTRPHPELPSNIHRGLAGLKAGSNSSLNGEIRENASTGRESANSKGAESGSGSDSSSNSIKTRFLLLSDTHAHRLYPPSTTDHAFRHPLPHADVLLHAGDLTEAGDMAGYKRAFELLQASDAEVKIVIAGNHDLTLDEPYWMESSAGSDEELQHEEREVTDKAWKFWTGPEARAANILYLEEGTHTVDLSNGARFTIYTSPFTPEFCSMAFAYPRERDRFNLLKDSPSKLTSNRNKTMTSGEPFTPPEPIPDWPHVDIVVTHGPPKFHMDGVPMLRGTTFAGCTNLLGALHRVRPRLAVFGHIHEGWGAEWVDWDKEGCDADTLAREVGPKGGRFNVIKKVREDLGGNGNTTTTATTTTTKKSDENKWTPGKGTESVVVSYEEPLARGHVYLDTSSANKSTDVESTSTAPTSAPIPVVEATSEGKVAMISGSATDDNHRRALRWGSESLLVNAAIMGTRGRVQHAPWVVDLDLPRAT